MFIRLACKTEYASIAKLHKEFFPSFFMTSLGENYLKEHYKIILKHANTICYIAENENNIVGFVIGRADAHNGLKKVVIDNFFAFLLLGLKLTFMNPSSLWRVIKNISKKDNGSIHDKQNYSEIGLIGVKPELKGVGIGHQLLYAFEKEAKKQGAKRLSLTTDYYNNYNTLAAYRAWGFEIYYEFISYPNRPMYRLIKDIK